MVGDHIRARRGERWVHGIDCGDETILHVNDGPSGPRVARTYRPAFVGGAAEVEVVAHRERVFPAKMVVARAWSPIRDPALAAMFADSEAFAHWCKTGRLPEAPANVAIAAPPGAAPAPAPTAAPARSALRPAKAKAKAGPKAAKAAAARPGKPPAKAAARKAAPRRGAAKANAKTKARTSAARKPARKAAGTRAATARRPARKARRGGR